MNILFVVERNLYYKFYGAVINEALKHGHRVFVLHDYGQQYPNPRNPKSMYFPFLNQIPNFISGEVIPGIFRQNAEITSFIKKEGIDITFSLHPKSYYLDSYIDVRWCCLQHGQDSFLSLSPYSDEEMFIYSNHWVTDKWKNDNPDVKLIEVGFYHYHRDGLDKDYIRRKYSLGNSKVFLYMPLDFIQTLVPSSFAKKLYLRYIYFSEMNVLKQIRNYCDSCGFHLVIKSRFKKILGKKFSRYGTVLYDESIYPSTIEELIYVADVVLTNFYYSTVVVESIFHKTKYITLTYDYLERDMTYAHRRYWSESQWKEVFLPDGLNRLIESGEFNADSLSRAVDKEYNQKRADEYISRYLIRSKDFGAKAIVDYISS